MTDFLLGQLDYIFFFYGLAFMMLGAVCFILKREKRLRLPWGWLGVFAFSHAVHEWLDIVDISLGPRYQTLQLFHIFFVIASFLTLTEFGRRAVFGLRGKGPGRWIFVPLLALALVGGVAGLSGLEAASRYTIGLVGGLWAAYALFMASRGLAMPPRRWLLAGSISLGLYAISTGIIPPFASFFPASLINNDTFLEALGFPVELARGVFAALAALSIWAYSQVSRGEAYITENRDKHIFLPVIILFFIVATGWVITQFAGNQAEGGVFSNVVSHVKAYRLFSIFTTFVFFSFTIVIFAALYFTRESTEQLRRYHERLEDLVKERTGELSEANQRLHLEISERERAEERQIELNRELENINKELNDFAYIVSHDLKAPLRAIHSLSSWIAADYADKFDDQGKEQINLLLKRVKRMYDLIEGILQYARVGRLREERGAVNLNELVTEIGDMLTENKNIRVIIEKRLPTIQCERTRIEQIFQNLLSNAVKFLDKPEGEIRVDYNTEGGYHRFSVKDCGPGIEERHFERIFLIFQTLSHHDEFESTGIGLALVKKIVEMYGGRVWVESRVGFGSTFSFTLPAEDSP